jgi:hypothetical protein
MKLFIKLMLLVVVAAVAAPFFISGRDGRPILSLDRLRAPHSSAPDIGNTEDSLTENVDETDEVSGKPVEVFKWQDENGAWHFSDTQEQGQAAQTVTVDPNASVVHLPPIKNPEIEEQNAVAADNNRRESPNSAASDSAPFGKITKLIDDSRRTEQLQQDRIARQERAAQE